MVALQFGDGVKLLNNARQNYESEKGHLGHVINSIISGDGQQQPNAKYVTKQAFVVKRDNKIYSSIEYFAEDDIGYFPIIAIKNIKKGEEILVDNFRTGHLKKHEEFREFNDYQAPEKVVQRNNRSLKQSHVKGLNNPKKRTKRKCSPSPTSSSKKAPIPLSSNTDPPYRSDTSVHDHQPKSSTSQYDYLFEIDGVSRDSGHAVRSESIVEENSSSKIIVPVPYYEDLPCSERKGLSNYVVTDSSVLSSTLDSMVRNHDAKNIFYL